MRALIVKWLAKVGYKIVTDKFAGYGFAALVSNINPFKTYG